MRDTRLGAGFYSDVILCAVGIRPDILDPLGPFKVPTHRMQPACARWRALSGGGWSCRSTRGW